jgi:hypothetical protein
LEIEVITGSFFRHYSHQPDFLFIFVPRGHDVRFPFRPDFLATFRSSRACLVHFLMADETVFRIAFGVAAFEALIAPVIHALLNRTDDRFFPAFRFTMVITPKAGKKLTFYF